MKAIYLTLAALLSLATSAQAQTDVPEQAQADAADAAKKTLPNRAFKCVVANYKTGKVEQFSMYWEGNTGLLYAPAFQGDIAAGTGAVKIEKSDENEYTYIAKRDEAGDTYRRIALQWEHTHVGNMEAWGVSEGTDNKGISANFEGVNAGSCISSEYK